VPWHVEKDGDRFCVVKDDDGSKAGCHGTRDEANAQLRALYASEPKMSAAQWEQAMNALLALADE
jgi:hypothetical protein